MEEALKILKLVWTEENTSFDGRFYRFPELTMHPRPVQRPHPAIVGGRCGRRRGRSSGTPRRRVVVGARAIDRARANPALSVYRKACTELGKPADWILRRYAWIAPTRREVEEDVLPGYVDGLMEHWRESVEDDDEKELFARIDAGEVDDARKTLPKTDCCGARPRTSSNRFSDIKPRPDARTYTRRSGPACRATPASGRATVASSNTPR